MRTAELRAAPQTPKVEAADPRGLRYVRGVAELFVPLVMMAVVGTLTFNFKPCHAAVRRRDLHGSDTTFTILFSVVSSVAVGALRARTSGRSTTSVRRRRARWDTACALGAHDRRSGQSFAVRGASSRVRQHRLPGRLDGDRADEAEPEMRGRVLALQAILFLGSTPIGGPILGWVSERFGARYAIGLGALAAFAAGRGASPGGRRAMPSSSPSPSRPRPSPPSTPSYAADRRRVRDHRVGPGSRPRPAVTALATLASRAGRRAALHRRHRPARGARRWDRRRPADLPAAAPRQRPLVLAPRAARPMAASGDALTLAPPPLPSLPSPSWPSSLLELFRRRLPLAGSPGEDPGRRPSSLPGATRTSTCPRPRSRGASRSSRSP